MRQKPSKRVLELPTAALWKYTVLRAQGLSVNAARAKLTEEWGGDPDVKIPNYTTMYEWETGPATRDRWKSDREKARQWVIETARTEGFALQPMRVQALNRQLEALGRAIEECNSTRDKVAMVREYRMLLSEMDKQMRPFEEAARKGKSDAQRWVATREKEKRWSKAEPASSTTPTN